MALWQLAVGGERRLARGPAGEGPQELLPASLTIDALLGGAPGALATALRGPSAGPSPRAHVSSRPSAARRSGPPG